MYLLLHQVLLLLYPKFLSGSPFLFSLMFCSHWRVFHSSTSDNLVVNSHSLLLGRKTKLLTCRGSLAWQELSLLFSRVALYCSSSLSSTFELHGHGLSFVSSTYHVPLCPRPLPKLLVSRADPVLPFPALIYLLIYLRQISAQIPFPQGMLILPIQGRVRALWYDLLALCPLL